MDPRSARLELRPLTTAHCDAALALWQQGVRRYLWDGRVITRDQALEALLVSERDFREHRRALGNAFAAGARPARILWPAHGRADGGAGADVRSRRRFLRTRACLGRRPRRVAACFDELGLPAVGAATDAANRRSSRLLEKLGGMHLVRRADHNGLDTLFYVCTIDDWASGVEA